MSLMGSSPAARGTWQQSFKQPGGQDDVQTLPTAVHSPRFSPLNASDYYSAPTADIVPVFDLSRADPRGNAHQSQQRQTGTTATPSDLPFTLGAGGLALQLRKPHPRQRNSADLRQR